MAKFVSGPKVVIESCYLYFNALWAINLAAFNYLIKLRSYSLIVSPKTCFLSLSIKSKLVDWLYVFGKGSLFMMGFLAPKIKLKRNLYKWGCWHCRVWPLRVHQWQHHRHFFYHWHMWYRWFIFNVIWRDK